MKKIIRLLIISVVVLLVTVLCIIRWKAWFGKINEPAYTTEQTIDRLVINMGEEGFNSRTITWRCGDSLMASELRVKLENTKDITTFPAEGTLVETMGGTNAYYKASITLPQGYYVYQVASGEETSPWYKMHIVENNSKCTFLVSGDIQDQEDRTTDTVFQGIYRRYPNIDFIAFLGDLIHRPLNDSWNLWFSEMDTLSACIPHVVNCGNHEYYKGRKGEIDPRWEHTFTHPHNGPELDHTQSYYLDMPSVRLIVIDTKGLKRLKDYRVTRRWLNSLIDSNEHPFCMVLMHHPVKAESLGRMSFLTRHYFKKSLNKVDIVLQGHDHSYARYCTKKHNELITPVYMLTTNSEKHYLSRCSRKADRVACGERLYELVEVNESQLRISTYLVDGHQLYDVVLIEKDENRHPTITAENALSEEHLLMPADYEGKKSLKVVRYKRCRELREQALKHRANKQ